jgi:uncharacterized damage-inducible protein DinB
MSCSSRASISVLLAVLLAVLVAPVAAHDDDATVEPSVSDSGFHDDLIANFEHTAGKLVALAEAIPADKYGWAPTDEVRTVSEVFVHVVGTNLLLPPVLGASMAEGVAMSEGGPMATMQQWEAEITEKEAVLAKLRQSVEYAGGAMAGIHDLETEVDLFGPMSKRAYLLILVSHVHEHLGQAIAYARSIGVVPPWSRPAPEAEKEEMKEGAEGD